MDAKIASYNQHKSTLLIVSEFEDALSELTVVEFAALLCHSGYIPDKYSADSTEETLYTKLIEALVKHWAVLIGFDKTILPTQKSSKEDVTISDGQSVVVCDTKSFRLGRSQKAPNVKDVLKHSDIAKWLDNYEDIVHAGGLVVLPSQHDWVRGSDFYQCTTDKSLPTLCLNYEHLSFILLSGLRKESLLEILRGYGDIFPSKLPKESSNRSLYYTAIEKSLFGELIDDWSTFKVDASAIVSEFVYHTENKIEQEISRIAADVRGKCSEIEDVETLINMIVDLQTEVKTSRLQSSSENIRRFRSGSGCYNEGYR